ncbi:hypothetical protein THAOC_25604, partial [Thalassiosira oceanica]
MAYLLGPLDMVLLTTLVRIVGLSGRAFSADPSDGGAEGAEADAPRAATASSDVSYGVNGNPVMAPSSPSSTHEATAQSSPAGASFGRRDPDPASPSSSFSQYEGSEQASRDDEEMATLTLPTRPFAVPNPYATPSHKQPNPIRAERRPTPEPTRPTLEQIRRSESNRLAALHRRRTLATPEPTRPTPDQSRRMESNRLAALHRRRTLVAQRRLASGSDPAPASSSSSFSQYEDSEPASR